MACTPLAVAPLGGPKYCGRFQPRLGARLAPRRASDWRLSASSPSVIDLAGNADDRDLAVGELEIVLGAFEMLGRELQRPSAAPPSRAALTALPATTAPRLAKVPAPQWN